MPRRRWNLSISKDHHWKGVFSSGVLWVLCVCEVCALGVVVCWLCVYFVVLVLLYMILGPVAP